jgi:hypothetical protein
MSNDKLKDLFHKKLYNYETEIQQSDWKIISERLKKKRRKIIPLFYVYYGVTGVAAALLLIMFLLNPYTDINSNMVATINENEQIIKPEDIKTAGSENQNITQNDVTNKTTDVTNKKDNINKDINTISNVDIAANITFNTNSRLDGDLTQTQNVEENINETETVSTIEISESNILAENTETTDFDEKQQATEQSNNQENTEQTNVNNEWWNQPENVTAKSKSKWTLALESGQSINKKSATSDFTDNARLNSATNSLEFNDAVLATPPHKEQSLATSQNGITDKVNMKHKHPLNFGIRLKKSFGERITLKTGLSYSYFLSEYKEESDVKIQQQIHYMGIPAGAEISLWKKNNFNLYVSGEFAIEKGIYSYKESRLIDINRNYLKTSGSIRGLQFSTNAGLGISYNLFTKIGIYIEPNIVYYLKDNRQLESFRTEKPFNTGLNIGLKYDL